MTEEKQEMIFDLLALKATHGLEPDEQSHLDNLIAETGITEDESFAIAAAAVSLVGLHDEEPLPAHLHARILASGDEFIASLDSAVAASKPDVVTDDEDDYQKIFTIDTPRWSWNWLGWAVAAAACVALAVNIWFTQFDPKVIVEVPKPPVTPEKLTTEQEYARFMAEPAGAIKANWAPGSPDAAELKNVSGDVVWSDAKQRGFMRFKGLPVNDKSKSTYQLWIFDKTQDARYPIDGGTFDVDKDGEVIIAINAKLNALSPGLFAITIEKPGGVVVSDRKRMAAVAKVETQTKSNT